ncbi:MAG: hypothetical protein AB7V46_14800, partial [Thermomicrobiales bacterium]
SNGQYIAQATSPAYRGEIFSFFDTPLLYNSTSSVDVGIGGADEREIYGFIGCRAGADHEGYLFLLEPTTGRAALWRQDATGPVLLNEVFVPNLVTPGANQFNRLGIDCFDDAITAAVNGEIVLSVTDTTYQNGQGYFGIGNTGGAADNLFGVFDNLVITDHGLPTGSSGSTGTTGTSGASGTSGSTGVAANPTFEQGMAYVQANRPNIGPIAGTADMIDGDEKFMNAGVTLANFYTEVTFVMPTNPPAGFWAVGFCFWLDPQGNCYSAFVGTNGASAQWLAVFDPASGGLQSISSGPLPTINLTPGAMNTFGLLVSGTQATVTMNSTAAAGTFTLPVQPVPGDVRLSISYSADVDGSTVPLRIETQGFSVWDISGATASSQGSTSAGPFTMRPSQRIAGPLSGSIVEDASTVQTKSAQVALSDFYAKATFTVPVDVSVPWDITIGFRDAGDGNEYRLTVFSSGEWRLTLGVGNPPIINGNVTNLLTSPGQVNTLEVLVQGVNGLAALNGTDISQFDASASLVAGDVWVGTAVVNSTTQPGRSTLYSDFEVWNLA